MRNLKKVFHLFLLVVAMLSACTPDAVQTKQSLEWIFSIGDTLNEKRNIHLSYELATTDSLLIFSSFDRRIGAINRDNGQLVWCTSSFQNNLLDMVVDDAAIYTAFESDTGLKIVSLSIIDGQQNWVKNILEAAPTTDMNIERTSLLTLWNSTLYICVTREDAELYNQEVQLFEINKKNGEVNLQSTLKLEERSPGEKLRDIIKMKYLYVDLSSREGSYWTALHQRPKVYLRDTAFYFYDVYPSLSGNWIVHAYKDTIFAQNIYSDSNKWERPLIEYKSFTPYFEGLVTSTGSVLYARQYFDFLDTRSYLHCLDLNSGDSLWTIPLGKSTVNKLMVKDSSLFVGIEPNMIAPHYTKFPYITEYNIKTGQEIKSYGFNGKYLASVHNMVCQEEEVYFITSNGYIGKLDRKVE